MTYADLIQRHRYARWAPAGADSAVAVRAVGVMLDEYLAEHHLRRDSEIDVRIATPDPWLWHDYPESVVLAECWALGAKPEVKIPRRRLRSFVRRHTDRYA